MIRVGLEVYDIYDNDFIIFELLKLPILFRTPSLTVERNEFMLIFDSVSS